MTGSLKNILLDSARGECLKDSYLGLKERFEVFYKTLTWTRKWFLEFWGDAMHCFLFDCWVKGCASCSLYMLFCNGPPLISPMHRHTWCTTAGGIGTLCSELIYRVQTHLSITEQLSGNHVVVEACCIHTHWPLYIMKFGKTNKSGTTVLLRF